VQHCSLNLGYVPQFIELKNWLAVQPGWLFNVPALQQEIHRQKIADVDC